MGYSIDQKVITLKEFGEQRFIDTLEELKKKNNPSDVRNFEWFEYIPKEYKDSKYLDWFFLMDNKTLVAFSTIQQYDYGTYRCMTRTYVTREYRSFVSVKASDAITVTGHFLPIQLEYLNAWKSVFITRQDPKRRRSFERTRGRAEYWTGYDWTYHKDLIQTFDDDNNPNAWQNVIYNGSEPELKTMSIERYNEIFPHKR